MINTEPHITIVRYRMGFPAFIAMLGIIGSTISWRRPGMRYALMFMLIPWAYVVVSFTFIFAHTLKAQDDALATQTQTIISNVSPIMVPGDVILIDAPSVFYESPVWVRAQENFPIMRDLILAHRRFFWTSKVRIDALYGLPGISAVAPYSYPPNLPPGRPEIVGMNEPARTEFLLQVERCAENAICVLGNR